MNGWRFRLLYGLVLFVAARIHSYATASFPNTPEWMLIYHGSAAAVDLILLKCAPWLTDGRLCDDMQATCFASMSVNGLGWLLYLAYTPPVFYDTLIAGICYVQFFRLLFVDRHDADRLGRALLRCSAGCRAELHA